MSDTIYQKLKEADQEPKTSQRMVESVMKVMREIPFYEELEKSLDYFSAEPGFDLTEDVRIRVYANRDGCEGTYVDGVAVFPDRRKRFFTAKSLEEGLDAAEKLGRFAGAFMYHAEIWLSMNVY